MRKSVCVVGCGSIAQVHARNLASRVDLHFTSRSQGSADRMVEKFGGTTYASFDDAITSSVDAVLIASPVQFHRDQVTRALDAGKTVLAEKPLCTSREELEAIGESVGKGGGFLMVAENYYYKPSLKFIRDAIADGAIGDLRFVSVKKRTHQEPLGWRKSYGALLEGGIHFVALISDLFARAPETVEAEFPNSNAGRPERESVLRLGYGCGVEAELRYSWNRRSLPGGVFQHSSILGDSGQIRFESNGLYVWSRGGGAVRWAGPDLGDLMGYRAMTEDFIHCLEVRVDPYSGFEKTRRDLEIVFRAYDQLPRC